MEIWFRLMVIVFLGFGAQPVLAGESAAQRVVSLSPIITETVYLLGAGDELVANTSYCNVPPEAAHKEKIGSVTQVNVEKIISLRPDLVVTSALTREKQIRILKGQGIRVMEIQNPKTFEQMCSLTRQMGRALGRSVAAEQLIERARKEVAAIQGRVAAAPSRRVFIQIGLKPLHTVNQEMFINEFIRLSNAVNIAAEQPSGVYSREMVIRENPDVILVATMGSSKKAATLEKKRWMGFSSLKAGVNHEIHVLDPELICSPTPISFVQGLTRVSGLIHPDQGAAHGQ